MLSVVRWLETLRGPTIFEITSAVNIKRANVSSVKFVDRVSLAATTFESISRKKVHEIPEEIDDLFKMRYHTLRSLPQADALFRAPSKFGDFMLK